MTSPLPPKRRDTRTPWDLLRQDRTNLRQLNNGLMGGRAPMLRPLPVGPAEGDLEDDDAGDNDTDQIAFWNTDYTIAAADRTVVPLNLTWEPLPGSLVVAQNGVPIPSSGWRLTDRLVTIPPTSSLHIHAEDRFDALVYAYYPTDLDGPEITSPIDEANIVDTTPTITGTGSPGHTITILIDDATAGTTTVGNDGTWSLTSAALSLASHTVQAVQAGADGDLSSEVVTFSIGAEATFGYESDWRYLFTTDSGADYSAAEVDDSGWAVSPGGFWREHYYSVGWPKHTPWPAGKVGWFRRNIGARAGAEAISVRHGGYARVWLNGVAVFSWANGVPFRTDSGALPAGAAAVLVVRVDSQDSDYFDAQVTA